ncbi:gamma-glutamylcyclotransferase family protein [Halomonas sp. C05BenzN]|uniref:gamma-glutamylcyclotransferase family protein n=1 Tax=Halomonas sp. C05BenzN TaxID=3411041 RepID=UPI003B93362C
MTRLRLLLISLFGLPLAVAGWLWLTMLSPFTYDPPDGLAPIADGPHEVFVYGTLRSGLVRWLVTGRAGESQPAVLEDFRREGLDLAEAPGERVEGEVIEVSAGELARLDRYERLGIRYERVRLELADGREVWVYRRLPEEATAGAQL